MPTAETICICGHQYSAHEHLRQGTDCAHGDGCTRFRRRRRLLWWRS